MSDVIPEVEAWSVGGQVETVEDLARLEWLPPREELSERSRAAADCALTAIGDAIGQGLLVGLHDVRLYGHAESGLSISAWPRTPEHEEVPGPEDHEHPAPDLPEPPAETLAVDDPVADEA